MRGLSRDRASSGGCFSGCERYEVQSLEPLAHRPGLPPLLIGCLGLWAASAVTFSSDAVTDIALCSGAACLFGGAALLSCIVALASRLRVVLLAAGSICLGIALGLCATLQVSTGHALADEGRAADRLVALADSNATDLGSSTICQALWHDEPLCKVVLYAGENDSLFVGEEACGTFSLAPLKDEAKAFYRTQGVCAQVKVQGVSVQEPQGVRGGLGRLRAQAISTIEGNAGEVAPLFCALICGYRKEMSSSALYEDFKACGLAHLVAVSGAHTSIVLMLLMAALNVMRAPRALSVVVGVLLTSCYVIFAGLPISAIRSAIMAILALTSFCAGRRAASTNAIAVCLIAFIGADPTTCMSVSLFLSAASTLGIILFAQLFASWFRCQRSWVRTALIEPVSLTLSSNMATLPFSAALFSQISLISPLANIVAAPLFALGCTAGLAGCIASMALPWWSGVIIKAASLALYPLMHAVKAMALIPYASIACALEPIPMICISCIACALLWIVWPRPGKRIVCVLFAVIAASLLILLGTPALVKPDEMSALDVGQGDAILIRSEGKSVLVDTGNVDAALRHELGRAGVRELDAIIVTHPDDDHCAALASLGSYVRIKRVCFAADVLTCTCDKCGRLRHLADESAPFAEKVPLRRGDALTVGRCTLRVIWPDGFTCEGGNADSLCLLGTWDMDGDGEKEWSVLLTGDAESDQLDQMISEGRVGDVDVLKVGHHGSRESLDHASVAALRPEIALISVGAHNRYGHPTEEALACLDAVGCTTYRTDESKTVTLAFAHDGIGVHCG